jgi:nucleoside-diphosphate kinase
MATRTFTMIKPDAVANGHIGNILANDYKCRFQNVSKINSTYRCWCSSIMRIPARPFYGELVEFMSRGPIVSAILKKIMLLKILEL